MNEDDKLKDTLDDLETTIKEMDMKRRKIFTDWVVTQNQYLQWEPGFNPSYLRAYKRGEIVFAHFGFNVGSEYGGMHYATVIKDSSKRDPVLNVVPLSSLGEDADERTLHRELVLLGVINGLNERESIAIPNQMRPISKIRIIKPKKQYHSVFKLSNEQMNLLDDKIKRLYTRI